MMRTGRYAGRAVVAAWVVTLAAGIAFGQNTYGLDWATIGHAGNRAASVEEMGTLADFYRPGQVNYDYRMMKTNLTVGQWVDFVRAYAPYYSSSYYPNLTGFEINRVVDNHGSVTWTVNPGSENYAIDVTWEMAARYCNWLENGKALNREAFEGGVYDTSTFYRNADRTIAHQRDPAPGAHYWIPSWDEYAKAAYYDPNRYGQGQEGYWQYPDMSDTPLIVGLPEDGGQVIGDLVFQLGRTFGQWDVNQYPDVQSYFGLIDLSGTSPAWTNASWIPAYGFLTYGAFAGNPYGPVIDRLDTPAEHSADSRAGGIRIAMSIPSPACMCVLAGASFSLLRRRRRNVLCGKRQLFSHSCSEPQPRLSLSPRG